MSVPFWPQNLSFFCTEHCGLAPEESTCVPGSVGFLLLKGVYLYQDLWDFRIRFMGKVGKDTSAEMLRVKVPYLPTRFLGPVRYLPTSLSDILLPTSYALSDILLPASYAISASCLCWVAYAPTSSYAVSATFYTVPMLRGVSPYQLPRPCPIAAYAVSKATSIDMLRVTVPYLPTRSLGPVRYLSTSCRCTVRCLATSFVCCVVYLAANFLCSPRYKPARSDALAMPCAELTQRTLWVPGERAGDGGTCVGHAGGVDFG